MLRLLPLLALASCGAIFGLSDEDELALARYQRNAQTYYGGGNFDRALDQVRRGLELSPNDYKLQVVRAWCLLRQSQADPRRLAAATARFDEVMALRADGDHSAQARLGHGVAHGKMALLQLREAEQIRGEADRLNLQGAELEQQVARATTLEQRAAADFDAAERSLQRLVSMGDLLLEAHYHLMYVKVWRGDYEQSIRHGNLYLERVAKLQEDVRKNLERTLNVDYERELRIRLQNRLDEETEVRAFLANLHYKQNHHELVVAQLDEVLLKNPHLYREYYNRGRSLLALGRTAEAKRDFERFLSSTTLPRENPHVKEALAALKELQ